MKVLPVKIALDESKQPEIFYSIQGEGPFTGRPSIFIRLSECNLYCHWCDTPYTWNWQDTDYLHMDEQKYDKADEQQLLDGSKIIESVRVFPCKHIVLSGGEPLLQQKQLLPVLTTLCEHNYLFDIETNGTVKPIPEFGQFINSYVVSPKLANAKIPLEKRIRQDALKWFANSANSFFKFVVAEPGDLSEILQLIAEFTIAEDKVYLLPAAKSLEQLQARQGQISSLAKEYGFRFSDRLHLRLYGDKRGV